MIYTGSDYLTAASYLADRNYGEYVPDLGYLSKTTAGESYWTKYSDLLYEETEFKFDKISDIYEVGLSYQTTHYPTIGDVTISQISSNNKTVSRYHAEYSYQNDLGNQFSNIVENTTYDLSNFLVSLNYQKYNKQLMYGDDFEVSAIRIGAKTFEWHLASDIAYTNVSFESEHISYFFTYIIDDNGNVTYYHSLDEYNNAESVTGQSYTFTYEDDVVTYTYDPYYYGKDNFYTYFSQEYVPIADTLSYEIAYQSALFGERHGNDEDLYTYYMYDCDIDIPMTLTTKSLGVKKSTFEMRYTSEYDRWFETGIPAYFNFIEEDANNVVPSVEFTAYNDGVFGMRINENENIFEQDEAVEQDESHTFSIQNVDNQYTNETEFIILSPSNMKELSIYEAAGVLNLTKTGWPHIANNIESLMVSNFNSSEEYDKLDKIMGVNDLVNLKSLTLMNCKHLKSTPSISNLSKLSVFNAETTNIESFKPAENVTLEAVALPESIKNIRLKNVTIAEDASLTMPVANLSSLTLDNVTGLDTFEFVERWNNALKSSNSLTPSSLIYLELNAINWQRVPATIMEDIKKFDLNIKTATISVLGTSTYGMLSREEYIKMTKLYGVNAFAASKTTEKVFNKLTLNKAVPALPEFEYSFTLSASGRDTTAVAKFDNTDNPDTIIAVNSVIDNILGKTIAFTYDRYAKYISHTFMANDISKPVDTKDTHNSTLNTVLRYGDIVLYNGDTLIIVMERIDNAKFQYIKLGSLVDEDQNLKQWFGNNVDNLSIHFEQFDRPEVANAITVKHNDEDVNTIDVFENTIKTTGLTLAIDVDNPAAENKAIGIKLYDLFIVYEHDENTNEYVFKATDNALIPAFGSAKCKVRCYLDGNLPSSNEPIGNYVYNEFFINIVSNSDVHSEYEDGIVMVDEDNISIEDNILTFTTGAEFDEETGILTIE